MKKYIAVWLSAFAFTTGYSAQVDVHDGDNLVEVSSSINPGDTLCINRGDYFLSEAWIITKPMVIMGCGEAVIHAPATDGALVIQSDFVSVEGLVIRDVQRSYLEDLAAIWVDNSSNVVLRNNRIEHCFFGVFATKSKCVRIEGNVIAGNALIEAQSANAIHLWYCDSMTVLNNHVSHHRDGVYLEFTGNTIVQGNTSENHLRYGLHFMYSHYNTYTQNTFSQNGAGVAVMFSNYITMVQNEFVNNWGPASYGLLLKEIRDSDISFNSFKDNTMGVYMEGCSRLLLDRNLFEANGWAIKVRGSSDDNDFTQNMFVRNSFDLASEAKQNPNRYKKNYWDRYSGYDLDRDGVGDVPHRPMSLYSHMTSKWEESILLMRSNFIEALNYAESVSPALTPSDLLDAEPLMKPVSVGVDANLSTLEKS